MTFPNASKGVKRIFLAAILMLIADAVSVIAAILGAAGLKSESSGLILGAGALLIALAILTIIAFIINITGVNLASKDEGAFKYALIALIVGIAANIVISAFSSDSFLSNLGNTISTATEFLSCYFIITGVVNLADRLGDAAVSAKGRKIRMIILCVYGCSAVLSLLAAIFSMSGTLMTIVGIVGIAAGVVSIIATFMYLSLLSKAKKMLAEK